MSKSEQGPNTTSTVVVHCECGKRLRTSPLHAGKAAKCPACGVKIEVPVNPAIPVDQVVKPPPIKTNRNFSSLLLWLPVALVGLSCISILAWKIAAEKHEKVIAAQAEAMNSFQDALKLMDEDHFSESIDLLKRIVANPYATQTETAQQLLAEAEIASSDKLTLDVLVSLSDEEFQKAMSNVEIADGRVTHPSLLRLRKSLVERNLQQAVEQRKVMKAKLHANQMTKNRESDTGGNEKTNSADSDANMQSNLSKDEYPEVKLFREKVASYLDEARAGAKLLKLSPSLSETVKKSQQIKELYVHLPDTPPEFNNGKEISGRLFLIQFHFETAPVYVRLFIESFRYKNEAHTDKLSKQIRKVAEDITNTANDIKSKMNPTTQTK